MGFRVISMMPGQWTSFTSASAIWYHIKSEKPLGEKICHLEWKALPIPPWNPNSIFHWKQFFCWREQCIRFSVLCFGNMHTILTTTWSSKELGDRLVLNFLDLFELILVGVTLWTHSNAPWIVNVHLCSHLNYIFNRITGKYYWSVC